MALLYNNIGLYLSHSSSLSLSLFFSVSPSYSNLLAFYVSLFHYLSVSLSLFPHIFSISFTLFLLNRWIESLYYCFSINLPFLFSPSLYPVYLSVNSLYYSLSSSVTIWNIFSVSKSVFPSFFFPLSRLTISNSLSQSFSLPYFTLCVSLFL